MLSPMRCHGFTLIELCFTLSIAGVLACWAVPSFAALWRNAALDHETAALLTALQYARAQSLALGEPVVLCQSEDLHQCLSGAARARGWLVFADRQRGSPVQVNAADEVLQVHALPAPLFLGGSRLALSYWPATLAGTTGTLTLCDDRGAADAHAVIVSQTGRPRISKVASDGSALVCAA